MNYKLFKWINTTYYGVNLIISILGQLIVGTVVFVVAVGYGANILTGSAILLWGLWPFFRFIYLTTRTAYLNSQGKVSK